LFSLVPVVFVVGAAIFGAWLWLLHQQQANPEALVRRMPSTNAAMGYLDVKLLRQSGLLRADASGLTREAEYEEFIRKSGFHWERDLDALLWSFTPDARFFFVTGRFDWDRLRKFAVSEGGECQNEFCTVAGSQPDRQISFFPWRSHVMALAVSEDRYAADRLRLEYRHQVQPADAPLWLHLSGTALSNDGTELEGLRGFLRLLERTQQSTLFLRPEADAFSLELLARCDGPDQASALASDFRKLTEWLNRLLKIEKVEPSETELAGILSTGQFTVSGDAVAGKWAVSRAFLESIFAEDAVRQEEPGLEHGGEAATDAGTASGSDSSRDER
jgi:hypothetical protein